MTATRWSLVFTLIGAGVICSFQIAKAAIAVPLLREDLGLSLSFASWVVSAYAAIGALAGLAIGVVITRMDSRVVAICGLLLMGAASCAGAAAPNGTMLIVSRLVEGCGFIPVVLAMPNLLRVISADKDHDVVMSTWASYVPIGMVTIMLTGPWLAADGWRVLWLGNGLLAIAYAGVIALVAPKVRTVAMQGNALESAREVLRKPGPLLLAGSFCLYAFHYHAIVGLMPTLLIDRMGLSIKAAGALAALTVVANAIGNLSAGWLMRFGLRLWLLIAVCFVVMAAMSLGIFATGMPVAFVAGFACVSVGMSGVIPGAIFAGAPRYTPRPELLAITLGVIVQASNAGQFLGPATLGGWADRFGWSSAPAIFITMAGVGIAIALGLRRASN
jgi:MFS family permease